MQIFHFFVDVAAVVVVAIFASRAYSDKFETGNNTEQQEQEQQRKAENEDENRHRHSDINIQQKM